MLSAVIKTDSNGVQLKILYVVSLDRVKLVSHLFLILNHKYFDDKFLTLVPCSYLKGLEYTPLLCSSSFIHSFIFSHSIDHTDVEFVIKYKYKQFVIKYKYNFR